MELLNTNQAAEKLKVTPIRIRQLIREGKIVAERVGRDYVIAENALESVKTYGKAGRPSATAESLDKKQKSFAEAAGKYIGSVDSGVTDLGSNKKHLENLGDKETEKAGASKRG